MLIELALQRETQSLAALTELQQVGAISEHEPQLVLSAEGLLLFAQIKNARNARLDELGLALDAGELRRLVHSMENLV